MLALAPGCQSAEAAHWPQASYRACRELQASAMQASCTKTAICREKAAVQGPRCPPERHPDGYEHRGEPGPSSSRVAKNENKQVKLT